MSNRGKLVFDFKLSDKDLDELYVPLDTMHEDFETKTGPELPEVGKPFDPIDFDYLYALAADVMSPVIDHYYRAEIHGSENLPEKGPAIVACNHSGNAFPHDAMVLDGLIWRHFDFKAEHKFRSVYSPKLAKVWWMRPFGLDNWWRRCGGVDMTFDNYDKLLRNGERIVYYPEGVPGIGKGFTRRYQLQHFYSSFVVLAAQHKISVTPVSCINAEFINPGNITFKWLDRLFDKMFGIPFLPLPSAIIGLLFPFFFYFGFPCQMVFVVGKPIDVRALILEDGGDPDNLTREMALKAAERVRRIMQSELDKGVQKYGDKPYKMKEWWQKMKELRGRGFWKFMPTGWPYAFIQHERNRHRTPAGALTNFFRDFDLLAFYLPMGWLLIALFRLIRKPPYGYRGLSRQERLKTDGSYLWKLEKRPIATTPETRKPFNELRKGRV